MTLTRSAGILAFYGTLAFLPKSLIRNQIRFFRFFPTFRLFPTFSLSDSTALVYMPYWPKTSEYIMQIGKISTNMRLYKRISA